MHVLTVYIKEWFAFARDVPLQNSADSYVFNWRSNDFNQIFNLPTRFRDCDSLSLTLQDYFQISDASLDHLIMVSQFPHIFLETHWRMLLFVAQLLFILVMIGMVSLRDLPWKRRIRQGSVSWKTVEFNRNLKKPWKTLEFIVSVIFSFLSLRLEPCFIIQ